TEEHLDSILSVHVKGHFACIKAAAKPMIAQKSGAIITVASRGAFYGGATVYAAAKAGIMGLTASLSRELKPHGITHNFLLASADTQLFPNGATRVRENLPSSLSRDPEDVAPVVAYLVSDAAKGVTGRFIYASGGDICLYGQPLQLTGATFLRKKGR